MLRRCLQVAGGCRKIVLNGNHSVLYEAGCRIVPKRGAGHAKWQNIKSTKEAEDSKRSLNFQRLSSQIIAAVKKGGEDPSLNISLRNLLEEAGKINMPKSTIQKAINSAKSKQTDRPYWVVFSGPKGVVLGLEVTFANKNAGFLNSKLASQTKKLNLKLEFHFQDFCSEKGIIVSKCLSTFDKAMEDAIEVGAIDVFEGDENAVIFECLPERLDGVLNQLIKLGYQIESSSTELDFNQHVVLSEEEISDINKVVAKLQGQYEEIIRASVNSA